MDPPAPVAVEAAKKPDEAKKEDAAATKACSACKQSFNKDGYSKAQWAKPADARKCKTCVEKTEGAAAPAAKPAAAGAAASAPPSGGVSKDGEFTQHIRLLGNWKKGARPKCVRCIR